MAEHLEEMGAEAVDKARDSLHGDKHEVPGPSPNPATNLIMADIAMRVGTYLLRGAVEKGFLRGRYGKESAKEIVDNRSMKQTAASVAVAKVATKSVPGAIAVGSGLALKLLFDASQKRRARLRGDRKLLEQARDD